MSNVAAVRAGLAATLQANVAGLSTNNFFQYPKDGWAENGPFGFIQMGSGEILDPRLDVRETTHLVTVRLLFSLQSGLGDAEKNAEGYVSAVISAIDLHKTLGGAGNVYDAAVVKYETRNFKMTASPESPEYYGLHFTVKVDEIEAGGLYAA